MEFNAIKITFLWLALLTKLVGNAATYPIATGAELQQLKLKPGDTVILKSGTIRNELFHLKGTGTKEAPIVLMAEKAGAVKLAGQSTLKIDGQWLVVSGLYFTDGYSAKDDVISFTKRSANCRLTNTVIKNYNPPSDEADYRWVSMYGINNRLDHCSISGKNHQGATVVVWLSEQPNYHQIDYNYFGGRPPLGRNGGETIRIGTSDWSFHPSYTTVEENVFDKCDGEIEIISVKSLHNKIQNNLFYESEGMVTLRHGNYNIVSSNFFIGNGKQETGGVRIIGTHHQVVNNYMQGLKGTGLKAAVSIMNATQAPKLNEYWAVRNAVIDNNIIVDCAEAFVVGSGKDDARPVAPDSIQITNNIVQSTNKTLVENVKINSFDVKGNKVWKSPAPDGFEKLKEAALKKNSYNFWQQKEVGAPFWIENKVGAEWDSQTDRAIKSIRIR